MVIAGKLAGCGMRGGDQRPNGRRGWCAVKKKLVFCGGVGEESQSGAEEKAAGETGRRGLDDVGARNWRGAG